MALRTNLLTNPSFEVDLNGWSGAGSRGNTTAGAVVSGSWYHQFTPTSESDKVPATAGLPYTGSAYFTRVGTRNAAVTVHFYDASNVELSPPTISLTAITNPNVPERRSNTRIAPAGTTQVALRCSVSSGTAVDAALLEQSDYLGDFFDGSTVKDGYTYGWTGTAHASTSTEASGVRTNLFPNPSIEADLSGFSVAGMAQQSGSNVVSGSFLGGFTSSGNPSKSIKLSATAGLPYTASAYFAKSTGSARSAAISLRFYDIAGVELSAPTVTLTTIGALNVPERRSSTRTAPANTTHMEVWLHRDATGTQVDAILLEQSATLGDFFDGSTVNDGYSYAWTGPAHTSTSIEAPEGAVMVKGTTAWQNITSTNSTLGGFSGTIATGDVLVLAVAHSVSSTAKPSAISGCGATWTEIASAESSIQSWWLGTGATSSGDIAATGISDTNGAAARLYHLAHVSATAAGVTVTGSGTQTSTSQSAQLGQIVLAGGYSDTADDTITATSPGSGWLEQTVLSTTPAATRFVGHAYRIPLGISETHNFSSTRASGNVFLTQLVLGDPFGAPSIGAAYTSTGTLTSELAYQKRIDSALSGSGTLTASFHRYVDVQLSGTGTLTSALAGRIFASGLSGAGTLSAALLVSRLLSLSGSGTLGSVLTNYQRITSALSGAGTLASVLTGYQNIVSDLSGSGTLASEITVIEPELSYFSGQGWLQSVLEYTARFDSDLSGEGVLYTELGYVVKPEELGTGPLGKRVNYSISTSAVPLNPTEGSGSTPGISAVYLKGIDPELALGERSVLTAGNIGTYDGEIVNLTVNRASSNVTVAMSTPLTLLNNDMLLFPFIDAAPSVWTAARAIDYWSQQCGLFYDRVPGDVVAYASAYGHNNSFAASNPNHFYERLTGGTTAASVINERTVRTFGAAVTGTIGFHEKPEESVACTVIKNQKLIFSAGVGIRGTGRTATTYWNFVDAKNVGHVLAITVSSAGNVNATVNGQLIDSTNVAGNDNYRIAASLEPLGNGLVGKLTVHTDDLAGNGTAIYTGTAKVVNRSLPLALGLKTVQHVSAGGSGSEMLHWGTYLTIDNKHPLEVPAVQKDLQQTVKARGFVSGFEGNVWNLLNEFCAIARLDVRFLDEKLTVSPRNNSLAAPGGNFGEFSYMAERRDKYKQVAIVNRQSKAVTNNTAVLYRADSVFTVAAREVFETTVQTEHSILHVVQPVAVSGIWPFPYKAGGGQYVVTGADGYIVSPAWWNDNGGKVEVSLTGKEGEIAIKITAPDLDTVRAPYRISEGEADRPALYISGSGILNTPKEVHVGTGAKNAKEGFDQVFESPFIAGVEETYDTAMAMASEYSAMNAEVDFEIPNDFDRPSRFGKFPAGTIFTDGVRNYRIDSATQTHSKISGTANTHTTIGAFVASLPEDATVGDVNARFFGATIRQFNIKPLRGTSV